MIKIKAILYSIILSSTANASNVKCDYYGIYSYFTGEQFVELTTLYCKVIESSDIQNELAPNYRHIKVDCTIDFLKRSSNTNGLGLVRRHILNKRIFWTNNYNCTKGI